jgi:amino acid adenylation domain-containing protein
MPFERAESLSRSNTLDASLQSEASVSPMFSAMERERIPHEWNDTTLAYRRDRCIHELFEEQVGKTPDSAALVCGEESLSYRELNRRANQLAHYLRSLGVIPDAPVGICSERGPQMIVALLAVLKAGGAYHPLDPAYPTERLSYMLLDSGPLVLLTQAHLKGRFSEVPDSLKVVQLTDNPAWRSLPESNLALADVGLTPEHLAYVIYTSGSTGRPKGVMVEHRSLCNLAAAQCQSLGVVQGSRVLQFSSFSFDACVWEIWMALTQGASLQIPAQSIPLAGDALLQAIERNGITHATLPPTVLGSLTESSGLDSLRTLVVAGESLSNALAMRWAAGRRLINAYGPTETTVCAAMHDCVTEEMENPPIGRPIGNARIYILDEQLQPVPVGQLGELYIGGVGLARGYFNRPELTAERFLTDPFAKDVGARMYRTGDLASWRADGNVDFVGRNDDQVKIRGYRIELAEIEARLLEHAQVHEAVVVAREDAPGEKRLAAYYTAEKSEGVVAVEQLRAHLALTLPEYMVPAAYVRLHQMPLTPNGKLDRKALAAPTADAVARSRYAAPAGELERALAAIWTEVLKLDRVGRDDNFFELGGDSLLAARVISRLRQTASVQISLGDIFARPRLADCASTLVGVPHAELPPIQPAQRGHTLPLSFAQQRLWFLAQMQGVSESYHLAVGVRLRGNLDRAALRRALRRLVGRHEALSTTFLLVDGEPVQRIAPVEESDFSLAELDLRGCGNVEAGLERAATREAATAFNLETGPLIRGQLVRLAEEEHALLITMHHIVSDAWSMGLLLNELSVLYSAFVADGIDPLPELPVQYADYALWQRQSMQGELLERQANYWKSALAGAPALLELPADHPRPAQQKYSGGFVPLELDRQLTAALKELSRRHGLTLHMTLLAGWGALLGRLSSGEDIVIGTPTANRGRSEIEGVIGFFINTLAIRLDLAGSPTVSQMLERVKVSALAAQEHQDIPFEQVVEILRPARSLSHSPIVQVVFAWQNAPAGSLELEGLEAEWMKPVPQTMTKFDLTLSLGEAGAGLTGGLEYASSLFERETVERYAGYFRRLLEGIVAGENQTVASICLLSEPERQQVVHEWNDSELEYFSDDCVQQLFETQVRKSPDAVAVVWEGTCLSYAELNRRANRLARRLRTLGVKPDARVGICVERGLEMVVGIVAVLKAGGAYVPLDPAYPAERLRWMVEDSALVVLLTQGHLLQLFDGVDDSVMLADLADFAADVGSAKEEYANLDAAAIGVTAQSAAYVIYTSGSTGLPKGVIVEHRNVTRLFAATDHWFHFNESDVWTLFHSYAFDFSVWEIWGALLCGGRLIVVPKQTVRSPEDFYDLLCAHGVTVLNQTPSAFEQLIVAQKSQKQAHRLRFVVFGGEALDVASLKPWYEQNRGASTRLINMYGITETTVHVTYRELAQSDMERQRASPIGARIPDLKTYILDEAGEPVPVGVVGELYVGGAGVARGYLNRPELTAQRFVQDRFAKGAGARMYRTGDLGRWLKDGTIEFVGRNDSQVKIRGHRIELGEVKAWLSEHAGVRECAVIVREDTPGEKRLTAYYTAAERESGGDVPGAEELRAHVAERLPEYMVPAAYVRLQKLPLTTNGKLDRKALPVPEGDAYARRGYEVPQGATETTLAGIWAELLSVERVGRWDDFFELGGHSLLAVSLMERMRRKGFEVDVRTLFMKPTLAELAAAIKEAVKPVAVPANGIPEGCEAISGEMLPLVQLTADEIEKIVHHVHGGARNVQDIYPLAPLQEGILFHHLMGGDGDPYLLVAIYGFESRSRLDRYVEAMQWVVGRHDILRTSVVWEGLREPVQVVWREARLRVEEVELEGRAEAWKELYARFNPRTYRMDVRESPLLRIYIAEDKGNNSWLMMLLLHHLVDDNTSFRKMQSEIQACLLGEAESLPEAQPFRNLVAQARLGVSREDHEAFFRKLLNGVEEPTTPFGLVDARGDGSGIVEARTLIEGGIAGRVRAMARKLGVSAAALWHVAWARVLAKVSGRDDVVFGTVLFGRMNSGAAADQGMGLFINTLPVRMQVGAAGAEESIRRMHKLLAELLRHEHAPLALAQRCSGVVAPAPLFSALLNYRHSVRGQWGVGLAEGSGPAWEGIKVIYSEERTSYPFSLSIDELDAGFRLTAQTVASIDPRRICEYMATTVASLTETLEKDPKAALSLVEVVPEQEKHRCLYEWNATAAEFPRDKCVHELFEEQVQRTPDAVAVICDGCELSYGELNRRANQLAHYLHQLGAGPDTRVAISMERSLDMVVSLMGVLKAGAAYVPLDSSYPAERLRYMVRDAQAAVVVTQENLREGFAADPLHLIVLNSEWSQIAEQSSRNPEKQARPENLAYVIYTSGSTGLPKGVCIEHRQISNYIAAIKRKLGLCEGISFALVSTMAADLGNTVLFPSLTQGGTLHVLTRDVTTDGDRFASYCRAHPIDCMKITPSHFQALLAESADSERIPKQLLVFGGEILTRELLVTVTSLQPSCRIYNHYGPTECTVGALSDDATACTRFSSNGAVPLGHPLNNMCAYVLDSRQDIVPVAVDGEICIGGDGVGRGYFCLPALTAERFMPNPFSKVAGARMYRTGDLGRHLPDGTIAFLGRSDDQVKIRGYRVELGEIAARLAMCAGVREAVVIASEDAGAERRLVAYYTSSPTDHAEATKGTTAEHLRGLLTTELPDYMVPVAYMRLERLPLTANGKLDRNALPKPGGDAYSVRAYEPPRGELEQKVAEIWSELLAVEHVGRNDNFFELGGHSLLAMQLISRIRTRLDVEVQLKDIFVAHTLKDMAVTMNSLIGLNELLGDTVVSGSEGTYL